MYLLSHSLFLHGFYFVEIHSLTSIKTATFRDNYDVEAFGLVAREDEIIIGGPL